jgi:hypothetical protein
VHRVSNFCEWLPFLCVNSIQCSKTPYSNTSLSYLLCFRRINHMAINHLHSCSDVRHCRVWHNNYSHNVMHRMCFLKVKIFQFTETKPNQAFTTPSHWYICVCRWHCVSGWSCSFLVRYMALRNIVYCLIQVCRRLFLQRDSFLILSPSVETCTPVRKK